MWIVFFVSIRAGSWQAFLEPASGYRPPFEEGKKSLSHE